MDTEQEYYILKTIAIMWLQFQSIEVVILYLDSHFYL